MGAARATRESLLAYRRDFRFRARPMALPVSRSRQAWQVGRGTGASYPQAAVFMWTWPTAPSVVAEAGRAARFTAIAARRSARGRFRRRPAVHARSARSEARRHALARGPERLVRPPNRRGVLPERGNRRVTCAIGRYAMSVTTASSSCVPSTGNLARPCTSRNFISPPNRLTPSGNSCARNGACRRARRRGARGGGCRLRVGECRDDARR